METIKKHLDVMYNDDKHRKFIMHLIRSFYPTSKVVNLTRDVLDSFKPYTSNNHIKCCITNIPLLCEEGCCEKLLDRYYYCAIIGTNTKVLMSQSTYDVFLSWISDKCMLKDKYILNIVNQEFYNIIKDLPEGDFLKQKINE